MCFPKKWLHDFLYVPVVLVFIFNFFIHANFYKTATWFFDAHSLQILEKINEEGRRKNMKLKVDYSWPFDSAIWYYLSKNKYGFVERVNDKTSGPGEPFDYYIFLGRSVEKTGYDPATEPIHAFEKDTVQAWREEGVFLFRNTGYVRQ
jgi:hypothetical protein